ncbi:MULTISPECIES: patatin-like phospholipase family protein [Thalassolituus]|uniref:Patatin n=1 Tax=hydrothermal vent metagenome TaxID=652676 RepID=A0A160TCJ4_9ZZZZ|nr:patatin-like phospholipase family protein [Thalassolituus oleivorans]PCI46450.1 MAG: Patatin [Oceanospirillales bacterium]AHK16249.1 patatin [Thalassolituus oleivorans R6-15]APR67606.1 Patatin [Thalassolituus oleivorans]MBQ0726964.1 patatin-like phospholipase family protein [Thalassolituus oleivorans]MBQ0781223.1 patatin-like phospholipase family protein [Thalassolituus oleivorans]
MEIKKTGLILSGGGARAAYQVGVLKAIHKILPKGHYNPFDIISGTSAGAINGVALASYAENYRIGIKHLERIWMHFSCDQIYRTDFAGMSYSLMRLVRSMMIGKRFKNDPVSLLDNTPLRALLNEAIKFDQIQGAIDNGALHAIAVNCSGMESGESVSFFQGHYSITNWQRQRRVGKRTRISLDHLMASSAIPMVFPAVKLQNEYFADGAVRQLAPLSPAIHLGAEKIMVIGVSGIAHKSKIVKPNSSYPSPAKVMGHMLNAAFLDSMEADVERMSRINRTLDKIPEAVRKKEQMELKSIQLLEINPSRSIDELAGEHAHEVPRALKMALGGSGNTGQSGSGILSYLLFSHGFCKSLIDLGYSDAMARADEIREFFSDHFNE